MSDLIDRQALNEYIRAQRGRPFVGITLEDAILMMISEVPSIEPERKKGKWIRHFDGNEWYWYCSSCKEQWYEEDLWMGGNSFPNFCPNCGADMREGDAE